MMFVESTHTQSAEIPALVLGSGVTALGVIRRLGRARIPVFCASRELGFVGLSRWCKKTPFRLSRYAKLAPFLQRLPWERAVLFACSDDWVRAVAELAPDLAERFPISQAPKAALETCLDKESFAQMLQRHDLPHPRTFTPQAEGDFGKIGDRKISDFFFKPRNSQAFSARYHVKAFTIASPEDALTRFRQVRHDGLEVMLQEFIPGPPTSHYFIDGFVDRKGRTRALFARRRIRMYPLRYGNSSYMTTVPLEEVTPALETLNRLIAALEYRGIFSAEFKFDSRDGRFKILELNVRPWWYIEFMALCGIDVSLMAYRDALGQDVDSVEKYDIGVNYVYPRLDLNTSIRMMHQGELSFAAWLNSVLDAKFAVFQWNDPLPSVADLAGQVSGKLRELLAGHYNS